MGRGMFTGRLTGGSHVLAPIDPLVLAQSRSTIALLILAPILAVKKPIRTAGAPQPPGAILPAGNSGAGCFELLLLFRHREDDGRDRHRLQYVAPVWVLLYMLARGLQRATPLRISGVVLAVIGCCLGGGRGGRATLAFRG